MTQKDLAEEYSIKEYKRLNDSEPIFEENLCFSIIDIKAAFNAGCESCLENIPKLKWQRVYKDGPHLAVTVFNWFYRIEFAYNEFNLFCNGYYISRYISLSDAKQATNEHYKKQIKKALGL